MIGLHLVLTELRASRESRRERGSQILGSGSTAPEPGTGADMPRYAQLVMGPAGSGKVRIWRKEGKVGVRGRQGGLGPEEGTGGCLSWGL